MALKSTKKAPVRKTTVSVRNIRGGVTPVFDPIKKKNFLPGERRTIPSKLATLLVKKGYVQIID